MRRGNVAVWAGISVILAAAVITALFAAGKPIALQGAVIQQDPDTAKQTPIADVDISAENGLGVGPSKSDFSGFFKVALIPGVKAGQSVKVLFRHPDYEPLELEAVAGDRPLVARMVPLLHPEVQDEGPGPAVVISNLIIRYSIEAVRAVTIGTLVKTFQAVNTGGIPCNGRRPCSADGKWKAAIGAITLDAGEGNELQNIRFSCIEGPCPFTKIDSERFSDSGRNLTVSAADWSDTATFLLEADVVQHGISNRVETAFPVILGEGLDFTLPAGAEGPSIEAELNGMTIVFPLGPTAELSWADCELKTDKNQSKVYRCKLKRRYRFQ